MQKAIKTMKADTVVRPASPGMMLYIKLVLTAIFWGGTFVAGRVIAREVGPFSAAFLRFAVTSVCLVAFLLKSEGRIPLLKPDQMFAVLMLGLTGIFTYNVLFFSGLKTVPAGRASLIIASNPAFIALLSFFFFRERATVWKVAGIVLSMSGAVVAITQGHLGRLIQGDLGWGELYIFGCVLSWVSYSLIGKVAMKRLSPLVAVTYSCLVGAALLLYPAYLEGLARSLTHYSLNAWLSAVYLGFFGSALGFVWYYEGIKAIGPSRAGVFINIVPVASIALAWLLLNEPLDISLAEGAILVIAGVYLTNRPTAAVAPPVSSPECPPQAECSRPAP